MGQTSSRVVSGVYTAGVFHDKGRFYRGVADEVGDDGRCAGSFAPSLYRNMNVLSFHEVDIPLQRNMRFRAVGCGSQHTILLSEDGQALYGWGRNTWGQVGCGADVQAEEGDGGSAASLGLRSAPPKDVAQPCTVSITPNARVTKVCCGAQHTLALLDDGSVFSWGNGNNGRLGHGDTLSLSCPKRLAALEPYAVTDIAAGDYHSACVTRDPVGWTFSWGLNHAGQLGYSRNAANEDGEAKGAVTLPSLITALLSEHLVVGKSPSTPPDGRDEAGDGEPRHAEAQEYVQRIHCGGLHTAVITSCQRILTFGGKIPTPRPVEFAGNRAASFADVALGYDHGIALTTEGRIGWWSIPCMDDVDVSSDCSGAVAAVPLTSAAMQQEAFVNVFSGRFFGAAVSQKARVFLWSHKGSVEEDAGGRGPFASQDSSGTGGRKTPNPLANAQTTPVPVLIDQLSGLGVVDIAGGSDNVVAVANRGLFLQRVVRSLMSATERNAGNGQRVRVIPPPGCGTVLADALKAVDVHLPEESAVLVSVDHAPAQAPRTAISKPNPEPSIPLNVLCPTLMMHPPLAEQLCALLGDVAEQKRCIRAFVASIGPEDAKKVQSTGEVEDAGAQGALEALTRHFLNEGSVEQPQGAAKASDTLLATLAAELKTSQRLVTALLAALLRSDARCLALEGEKAALLREKAAAEADIADLRAAVDQAHRDAGVAAKDAEKKLQEREFKWRNTVQHLRQQLDARRRDTLHSDVPSDDV